MKPHFRVISWLLAVLGLSITPATALTPTEPDNLGLLVPAYFYPGANDTRWAALAAAAQQVSVTAILNPASGPGNNTDSNYEQVIRAVRAAGGRVIGYVHTQYGKRSLNEVAAEINRYANLYEIDGIFVDEMASDDEAASILYFESVYQLIKAVHSNWLVVGNPGVKPARRHLDLPTADTFVQFEQTGAAWRDREVIHWPAEYGKERFAELIHSVSERSLVSQIVDQAIRNRIGYVYVTDDLMNNPWDELPTWWEHLVSLLANRSASGG